MCRRDCRVALVKGRDSACECEWPPDSAPTQAGLYRVKCMGGDTCFTYMGGCIDREGLWSPPLYHVIPHGSTCWAGPNFDKPQSQEISKNRLACGCVLYARIMMEQGADRFKPGINDRIFTNDRIYHLEPGDRITTQFWLQVARNGQAVTCKLRGEEHAVRLDDCELYPQRNVQRRHFDTAPWIRFTLVADKPESDHDVGHVPLRADQLPGQPSLSENSEKRENSGGHALRAAGRPHLPCDYMLGLFLLPSPAPVWR